ncbi:MAG: polysaccharide biosynthesis/export family protein [Paracoccaceae bacterium]
MSRRIVAFFAGALALLATGAIAQDGYRLRSGDTLRIEVLEDPTLNRAALIAPDGRIAMPLAGGIRAAGRTLEAVQGELAAKLEPNFAARPTVYVALEQQKEVRPVSTQPAKEAVIAVFVVGEAAKPGKLNLTPGTTLLQAFAEMGGFSKFAATKRIQLRRGAKSWTLNYKAIEAGVSQAGETVLAEGDVIVIPQRKLFE